MLLCFRIPHLSLDILFLSNSIHSLDLNYHSYVNGPQIFSTDPHLQTCVSIHLCITYTLQWIPKTKFIPLSTQTHSSSHISKNQLMISLFTKLWKAKNHKGIIPPLCFSLMINHQVVLILPPKHFPNRTPPLHRCYHCFCGCPHLLLGLEYCHN